MSADLLVAGARRSWSQLNNYLTCGEQYRLERIEEVPQPPAIWFIGGSAFHTATEWLDKGEEDNPRHAWFRAWNDEFARTEADTDVPLAQWRVGGRSTKANPDRETASWWMEAGADMVEEYVKWRDGSGWTIAEFNGVKAVELEVMGVFGDQPGVPVKGFLDRLFVTPDGELVLVDLKTGSRTPPGAQNGLYASLMERTMGVRPTYGAYYMARKGSVSPPERLERFSLGYWDKVLPDFDRAVAAHIFLPNVSALCNSCGVREHCVAFKEGK